MNSAMSAETRIEYFYKLNQGQDCLAGAAKECPRNSVRTQKLRQKLLLQLLK